jgi:hypothetical protein
MIMITRYLFGAFAVALLLVPANAQDRTSSSTRPPELVKLEAQAATEIPLPTVPPGRAEEVKKVAETSVALRRSQWVVEKLLPPPPEGLTSLKFTEMKVGSRGWVDLTGDVVKMSDGVAVVRTATGVESVMIAVPVTADVTELKAVTLRGEYVVEKPVTYDGREVFVLKEVTAAKPLDEAKAKIVDAARKRLEVAKAAHAQAVSVLKDIRLRAEKKVMEKALAAAEKQIPVPKDVDVEEQVKIKAKQQELAGKLAKEELEKIAMQYADFPVIDPIDGTNVERPTKK